MLGLAMGRLRLMIQGIAILGTEHRLGFRPVIQLLSLASLMECCIGNTALHQGPLGRMKEPPRLC
jgi:hypothetical protein